MGPMLPSVVDRSQVPAGSVGETGYLYMPCVPLELDGGADWDTDGDAYIDRVIRELDTYAPGLEDSIIGRCIHSPKALTHKSARGNVVHVDMSMAQLGPNRPTRSLSGFRTPVRGLWHAGAGAHPMGALSGWNGRTAARTVAKELRDGAGRESSGPAFPPAGLRVPGAAAEPRDGGGHQSTGDAAAV
jgi:phytoene dehydrogenase-like protein